MIFSQISIIYFWIFILFFIKIFQFIFSALYIVFWWLYLFSHYIAEEFMLSTWDIIEEHFGFMLVWGDMVYSFIYFSSNQIILYLPFLYSICGWYMADYLESWDLLRIVVVIVTHLTFHYIFRSSNWQNYSY